MLRKICQEFTDLSPADIQQLIERGFRLVD